MHILKIPCNFTLEEKVTNLYTNFRKTFKFIYSFTKNIFMLEKMLVYIFLLEKMELSKIIFSECPAGFYFSKSISLTFVLVHHIAQWVLQRADTY